MSFELREEPLSTNVSREGDYQGAHDVLDQPDALESLRALKLSELSQGREVADLSMLNPDLTPPRFLLDKLMEASAKPYHHRYAVSRGIRRLRDAFAEKYHRRFGAELRPESEICATLGTKDGIVQALRVLTQAGDPVLCVSPVYPAYRSAAALLGLSLHTVSALSDEGTLKTTEELALALGSAIQRLRPRVVLLNFPNNPTGLVVDREFWSRVLEATERAGSALVNDFVYGELLYTGGAGASVLSVAAERAKKLGRAPGTEYQGVVESYSLSKAYNVPGWRVGALLGDGRIVERVARMKSLLDYGIFLPVQFAAAAGLEAKENLTLTTASEYRQRAQVLVSGLSRSGFASELPLAGGSIWARCPDWLTEYGKDRGGATPSLLLEAGILAAPGTLYGEEWKDYLRFALVLPAERLREATQRIFEVRGKAVHA